METKTINLTIHTDFAGCDYNYTEEIEYDGTEDDLERKIGDFYEECLQEIIGEFYYEWEAVDE